MNGFGAALAASVMVGAMLSTQSFFNGALGVSLGSAHLAAAACSTVAFGVLFLVGVSGESFRRIGQAWRHGQRPRAWHFAACGLAAVPFIVVAAASPVLGIAMVTIALIGGQVLGSVVLDLVGLAPGGKRPLTRPRVAGVVVALGAVLSTGFQGVVQLNLPLLILTFAGGAGIALVSCVSGHVAEAWGGVGAGVLIFCSAAVVSWVTWVVVTGGGPPPRFAEASLQDLSVGGILGVVIVVTVARIISMLGALVLTLGQVAGQVLGAVAIDLVAPAGQPLTGLRACDELT